MKRLFIMLALIATTVFTSSYAADVKTFPVVTQAFEIAFHGAKDVKWEQIGVLYKASFELNTQYSSAFYNSDGELIAVTRQVPSTSLPKALQASLKQEMKGGAWITQLFVVTIENDNTYYVTLDKADMAITLRSVGAKKWTIYQKAGK